MVTQAIDFYWRLGVVCAALALALFVIAGFGYMVALNWPTFREWFRDILDARRLRKGLAALLLLIAVTACAHGPRHVLTVSLVSSHSVLSAIQDTEALLVCGRPTAPPAPQCVPLDKHRAISAHLATAFGLEAQAARVVRSLPVGAPQPAEVSGMVAQVSGLVVEIMKLIPQSKGKQQLAQQMEAH